MNGIHPKLGLAAAAALALAGAAGCSNQPGALKNPFSAVDRVPPPSTRVLAPGTAQPYYQGDPLPAMQSANGFTAPTAAAIAGMATPTPASAPTARSPAPAAEPKKLVFTNEPIVAIPSDGNSLRFELPPPPEPIVAATSPAPAAANEPTQVLAAPQSSGVVPAAYAAIPTSAQPTANAAFNAPTEPALTGPWRSPQVARQMAQPAYAPPIYGQPPLATPSPVYPPAAAQPSMDVQLRAVASPEPVAPSTPRIRLPGYPAPQPASGGAMQVVQIAPGPPQGYYDPALGTFVYTAPPVGSLLAPAPAATSGSRDGFRPRSSMR